MEGKSVSKGEIKSFHYQVAEWEEAAILQEFYLYFQTLLICAYQEASWNEMLKLSFSDGSFLK